MIYQWGRKKLSVFFPYAHTTLRAQTSSKFDIEGPTTTTTITKFLDSSMSLGSAVLKLSTSTHIYRGLRIILDYN